MARAPRTPANKTSATSATKRTATRNPTHAKPTINSPVPDSGASRVAPARIQGEATSGLYRPGGHDGGESPLAQLGAESGQSAPPRAEIGRSAPIPDEEVLHGGAGDHEPGPAANARHPTERFDHSDDLSADERIAALAEIEDEPAPEETLEQTIARIRGMRRPLGSFQQKLAIDPKPHYHTHWFNDEGNRIAEALESGWAFRRKNGKTIRRAVGTGRDKGVLWAYAMDLPTDIWNEDQAKKHALAKSKMDSIKSSPVMAKGGTVEKTDAGKFYSPSEVMIDIQKAN